MRAFRLCLKRLADIICSLVGLLLLSPLFLGIAAAIKCSSPGPVFFRQERLGRNGRVFRIWKFRTMVVNAEHMGQGLRVTAGDDPRITRAGRFLRSSSLDELPQLFNVLGGSMSLVGPRPPATYHPYDGYENYPGWARKRFVMRPGITGLAQVTVRNSVPWDDRIRVDNRYVDTFSLLLDIRILFMTAVRVFRHGGIYADHSAVYAKKALEEKQRQGEEQL